MQQSSSYLAELVRLNDTLIWSWDRMDSFVAAVRIIRDTVGATLAPSFLVDPTGTRLELVGGARERAALEALGWRVETIWECELKDEAGLTARLRAVLDG